MAHKENVERFITNWNGKKLLEKHTLESYGFWKITGEDPNCDFGGHHHNPDLGVVEGKLIDVIHYAVDLPRFWSWGGGGDIVEYKKTNIKKVDSLSTRRDALLEKITKLKAELAALEDEYKDMA